MSTSRVNEDIARQFGCPCHRTAVGEANVVDKMRDAGAVIGGEGNGGVIDPRVGWVRDPYIGMGLVLQLLADIGNPLSEIVAALPSYTIVKDKYTVSRELLPRLNKTLEARWLARRFGLEALGDDERAELLASLDAADREIDAGPTHSATELRQAVREWAGR